MEAFGGSQALRFKKAGLEIRPHNTNPGPTTPRWATRLSPPATTGFIPTGGTRPMLRLQSPLPDRYTLASDDELETMIRAAKADLGDRLLILGHHYQRPEVIRWADMTR